MKPLALAVALLTASFAFAFPPEPADPPAVLQAKPAPVTDFTKPLEEALAGKIGLDKVRIDAMWEGKSATIYGNGVAIWNREAQTQFKPEGIMDMLKGLQKMKFDKMADRFGGLNFGGREGPPERLLGHVSVVIGSQRKSVTQLGGGEQSKEFADLAWFLVTAVERRANVDSVRAASLPDALDKVAKKQLMPEVMALLVQRIDNDGRGPDGWIMRLNGRTVRVEPRGQAGLGTPKELELSEKELAEVCKLLIDNDVGGFPVNLWAPTYTDFTVTIFRFDKNLQARQFARMTPQTHGEKQVKFDRMYEGLDKLRQRALKEGKDAKTPMF
jgi:hypothetical protein